MTNTSKWFAAIGFAALGASSLGAQGTTIDPRWQAWIGCWAPAPDAAAEYEVVLDMAQQIAQIHALGVQLVIVVGGGNIFRGVSGAAAGMDRASGDTQVL